ncbi:iron complex transport system substrate-binding protein [Modicisalibacter ilicicola DSM 19980]|uniref:Iron complex transport system substrate-binding protein n=1 Tax=Modicisalibacter ilicicola DSM 19980 TaxID=1121942 RepID=A0A1M4X4Z5_9GAMM|nr:cobalamin-binding protein [Halomonas ilicicola]SHE88564.1 iron complex transport system substrate-binding protein [Halomonas ilicicola DSM 19980]
MPKPAPALTTLLGVVAALLLGANAWADVVTVTDDLGNDVTLPAPAERVVALAPHAVEMLYAVDAGERLVGAIEGSDYPVAARAVPRTGSYRGIALEAILVRDPQLVIAWGSGTPQVVVERLRALDIAVYVSEPRHLSDVADNLRDLGRLTGQPGKGERIARNFEERLASMERSLEPAPRVFYQLGADPLTTLADGHIVTQVIRHCGGQPLFAESPVLVPQIGREALVEARPEVILAASENDAWQASWQKWSILSAVRDERLHTLEPDWISRPGPRLIEAVEQVCDALAMKEPRIDRGSQ